MAEINRNFPIKEIKEINGNNYLIHCSETFMEIFYMEVLKAGYTVLANGRATEFDIPAIGHLIFAQDMEQGYKIEKI